MLGSVFDGMSEHNLSIIKDLKLLKQLSLSGTSGILNLESSLIHLVNLEYLTVENIHEPAPITDLSFLSGMQKLNTLILSTNGITQSVLDSTMPALESLMVIDLRDNDGIKEFKRENGKFPKLVNVIL